MASRKKTWVEKLADKENLPKYLQLEERFPCYNAVHRMGAEVGDTIVLANPGEVVEQMRKVPRGRLVTIVEICRALARKHGVRGCCTLTTGIFIMTAANAAEEVKRTGDGTAAAGSTPSDGTGGAADGTGGAAAGRAVFAESLDIPYWRTLKADGFLNEKYPGGAEAHRALLEGEGFEVQRRGKRFRVPGFRDHLVTDL